MKNDYVALKFLLAFLFVTFSNGPKAQFEMGDEPGVPGGTLWTGTLPTGSGENPGRPGMFKLMWNSKVTKMDMIGSVQGDYGKAASAGAEVWKSYDFEKKTFSDTTLKTNFSLGYGLKTEIKTEGKLKDLKNSKIETFSGASRDSFTGKVNTVGVRTDFEGKVSAGADVKAGPINVRYNKVISKPANDGSVTNSGGKKANVSSGTGLMDTLWAVFGQDWHKNVAENSSVSFEEKDVKIKDAENYQLGGKVRGVGLIVGKSQGSETVWAGAKNTEVGYVRNKDDSTKFSFRGSTFVFPNVKAGGGVNLYMVPMTLEEIKIRNKNLAKSYNSAYSSSMASNMGFVLETEL